MNNRKMFQDELQHLEDIKQIIDDSLTEADARVLRLDRDYREAKQYMVDSYSDMDRMEILQNEKILSQKEQSGALAVTMHGRMEKLKDSPYFARIDFRFCDDDEEVSYYIGRFGFDDKGEQLIFDWRAPISGMFYDYDVGPAQYQAPAGKIEGELTRKRQFKIKNGILDYVLESTSAVQDEVLQRELAGTSDEKMKTIISTIQREQNAIIRSQQSRSMIIQGVAGSGKTSVALHRTAFLLYRYKDTIASQDVAILSPNKVFADYISEVIPELGEEPIRQFGLTETAHNVLDGIIGFEACPNPLEVDDPLWHERVRFKSSMEFLHMLEDYVTYIRSMQKSRKPLQLYKDFFGFIGAEKMLVLPAADTLEWEDVFPFIYMLAFFGGVEVHRELKHLVIDEMQDYTPVQYKVLNMLYPCSKTILGDFGQVLNPCHTHSADDMREIFKDAEFITLNRSYRSTKEIMMYADSICPQPGLEPIDRHGPEPEVLRYETDDAQLDAIIEFICKFEKDGAGSLAVITKTGACARRLFNAVTSLSPELRLNLLDGRSTQFSTGVTITPISMAKGLEFDEVIIPDADNARYASEFDRNLLYIACTRAMHRLTLTYTGEPSPFI